MTNEEVRSLLESLLEAIAESELYGEYHTRPKSGELSYENKIVVVSPKWFKPMYRVKENQLFLALDGLGCDPDKTRCEVYGMFLVNEEQAWVERYNIIGIMKDECIPKWAKERVKEYADEILEEIFALDSEGKYTEESYNRDTDKIMEIAKIFEEN